MNLFDLNELFSDIGMTIGCNEDGKFQIQHWPPLPVDDAVEVLQILEVRMIGK
jgi:hypothetical protein